MKRALAVSMLVLIAACSSSRHHTPEASQENFGVNMARMNLWREALFRFQRAVQMNPTDAMAHNNLAVAYEANGDFDSAAKEYREAMRLDKSNQYIQKNYSRFVEFVSRNKKRQRGAPAPPAKTAAATAMEPASSGAAAPAAAPPVVTTTAEGPAPSPQPTGTAPAAVPPAATAPPPTQPPATDTAPPPAKPPGER
ncbi:MAG TPA: tetratricopeptide repeat protein [Thermoanaerobaculia bacterium]